MKTESQQAYDAVVDKLLFILETVDLEDQLPLVELFRARAQIQVHQTRKANAAWLRSFDRPERAADR